VGQRQVDVTGIENHEVTGLKMVDAAAVVESQREDVVVIMRQYAYHGSHRTIHSSAHIEAYKNILDDRSIKVGGRQCVAMVDGYILPLNIFNGLPYLRMHPCSQD
jgi:hypothetical protein